METLQSFLIKSRGDLSLREAAKLIGISHSYLSSLEKGKNFRSGAPVKPSPETLELISKAYKIDYNELMRLAGYLPDKSTTNTVNTLEHFKDDLTRRLQISGLIDDGMSDKEVNDLIDKVIKILEISKSN